MVVFMVVSVPPMRLIRASAVLCGRLNGLVKCRRTHKSIVNYLYNLDYTNFKYKSSFSGISHIILKDFLEPSPHISQIILRLPVAFPRGLYIYTLGTLFPVGGIAMEEVGAAEPV